jgi:hypothetical protein
VVLRNLIVSEASGNRMNLGMALSAAAHEYTGRTIPTKEWAEQLTRNFMHSTAASLRIQFSTFFKKGDKKNKIRKRGAGWEKLGK